jgi:hypothetical protein
MTKTQRQLKEKKMTERVMSELEEMIVEDMREWVTLKLLNGEDMFEHLDEITINAGEAASNEKLKEFTDIYWRDHLWP